MRRLPERAGVPGGARGCAVCRVCVPGVCRVCAGCAGVSGVCGLCGLCLSNVPGMCWPCWVGMRIGRLVWGVVGVCRAVPAKRAGCVGCVPGVCRMCAARACMGRAAGVRGVRVCAGSVPGVCGRAWVGGVPGVCRVVCWVRGGCAMQGIQRGVCRSVWVCRERVPDMGCAGVCRVPGVCVPGVCRVCAGVLVGGVWAVWPVLEQCAGYVLVGRLVWGVVGVCRAVPAKRAGCVGCARCVPGVCQMCAARACMGRAAGVRGVCRECAGRVRESMGRGCAGRVPGGVLGALGVCHARHPARRLPERAGVPGARAGCGVCGGVPCAGCVPGVCRVCAGVFVGGVWAVWPVLEQ